MDFHDPQTWDNYDPSGIIKPRLELVKKLIPSDVQTILDAGCGNGIITNALGADYDVTGLDISPVALEQVTTNKVLGSVTALPFAERTFDLVMCNEVLEHLETEDVQKAITELKRCARNYLLISVPYEEQIERELVKCRTCGLVSNVYGHLQRFSEHSLDRLTGLKRMESHLIGPKRKRFNRILLSFRQHVLQQWYNPSETVTCPQCGGKDFIFRTSLLTKAVNAVGRINFQAKPYWLIALYRIGDH
jgi:SAM-dependent methyltransferase